MLCLKDISAMTGVYEFTVECSRQSVQLMVGIEFQKWNALRFIGIAQNLDGLLYLRFHIFYYKKQIQFLKKKICNS